jgi:hypothetical protein
MDFCRIKVVKHSINQEKKIMTLAIHPLGHFGERIIRLENPIFLKRAQFIAPLFFLNLWYRHIMITIQSLFNS